MDSSQDKAQPQFFEKLVNEFGKPREYRATYTLPKEAGIVTRPNSLFASLELDESMLSPIAKETLDALETAGIGHEEKWMDFKWKLDALNHLQDIFDVALFEGEDPRTLFHQYYFYYESRYILAESILAGLNGFYIAANALLRPFLEFSLLQNYFYRLTNLTRSYKDIEKYFKDGINPSWATVLKKALPKDTFSKPIRYRIHSHLAGLSASALHPYHPDDSVLQHKNRASIHSIEGVHFWITTHLVVEAALWTYYINFPLVFHPIPVLRKFGYKPPVGIVIDKNGGAIIRQSLKNDDYQAFKEYSLIQDQTISVLEWIKGLPDLSDDEIRNTWDNKDGTYPGLWPGYGQTIARMRCLRGSMALRQRSEDHPVLSDGFLEAMGSLKGWRKVTARHENRTPV